MRPPAGLLLALAAVAVAEDYTVRFDVQLEGEKELSSFKLTVREKKAPLAARRFLSLVREGFFDGCPFFRVLPGYLVQFGLNGNVTRQREFDARGPLRDETNIEQPDWNIRGSIAFATTGPNSRSTQVFINYDDNHSLDSKGYVTFGRLVDGMATLSAVYAGYRERPKQSLIRARGDAYLKTEFPRLTYIVRAQQVAFIEEPLALSKNATGLLLTLGMVACALVCCGAMRLLQRKLGTTYAAAAEADFAEDFRPREDDDEGEEGEEADDEAYGDVPEAFDDPRLPRRQQITDL